MSIIQKVKKTIQKHSMLFPDERVLVAVSGGPDSVALFHLLWELREELRIQLVIAHYHHELRGRDADMDEQLARQMAEKFKVEFIAGRAEPEWWKKLKGSIEELARNMRYEFLVKSAIETKASKIALGHNADDQAESVLINLLRGSGLLGLAGMPPVRDRFIRPLIEVSRKEILDYCWDRGLAFRVDRTNRDKRFLRNRIRSELIPMLKTFNPSIVSALVKTSELLREDEKILEEHSKKAFSRLAKIQPGQINFSMKEFMLEPASIRRRLVRLAIQKLKKDLRRIEALHIFEMEELMYSGKASFALDMPERIKIFKSYDQLSIKLAGAKKPSAFEPVKLTIPADLKIRLNDEFELALKIEPSDYAQFLKSGVKKQQRGSIFDLGAEQIFLSLDNISSQLWLRAPKPGDRIQPLGMKGHKKLKEILQSLKVPRQLRPIYPLVVDDQESLWVPGFEISEKTRIAPDSKKICRCQISIQ